MIVDTKMTLEEELKELSIKQLTERIRELQKDPEFRREVKEFIKETT